MYRGDTFGLGIPHTLRVNMPDHVFTDIDKLALNDRIKNAHTLDEDGFVILRTSAKGTFTFTGLNKDWLITTMQVDDVAIALPVSSLSDRNSIMIRNTSETETVYIGKSNVTADLVIGVTSGLPMAPGDQFAVDVRNAVTIYGRCASGKSAIVQVVEFA